MSHRKQAIDPAVDKLIAFIRTRKVDTTQMADWERQFLSGYICFHGANATVDGKPDKARHLGTIPVK
jgi:hypothetical protein